MSDGGYDPARCDLCGSGEAETLVRLRSGRAMRSDRTLVEFDLEKRRCSRCGLVRDARRLGPGELEAYYAHEYASRLQPGEHVFYTPNGPVPRSRLLADWLVCVPGEHRWRRARRGLEVGAGSGVLLQELRRRFPGLALTGVEPGGAASAFAREKGLELRGSIEEAPGDLDLAYAVAVIEHVASPTAFLKALRPRLRPGGSLILCQPTQDVPSYDVLFVDHLHHFGTGHLRAYARKCGFVERGFVVGHEWMPNFSLHLFEATEEAEEFCYTGPPLQTEAGVSAARVVADFARLDARLAGLGRAGRRVAVLGLNEVYWLARAYSSLGSFPVVCGLDDDPGRPEHGRLGFPVLVPERCPELGVQDVLLAVNTVYYPQLKERLRPLGVVVHEVLT
jgi:SAM-dependent methyltransferase